MKITRLRKGYRISLNDAEFEALSILAQHGQVDFEGVDVKAEHGFPARIVTALERGRLAELSAMRIDEDRRETRDERA